MKYSENNTVSVKELPSDERPREKIFSQGVSGLSDAELLSVIIASGSRGESSIALSGRLLASGGMAHLSVCQPEEFMKIRGIGEAKACSLAAAFELGRRTASLRHSARLTFGKPGEVAAYLMESLRRERKEYFLSLLFNTKNELMMKETVSIGGISEAPAMPREIFATAVKKGAAGIIIAHNHPSGDPTPSRADMTATFRIAEAGKILGIPVLDHIIIGDGRYVSFREEKLL